MTNKEKQIVRRVGYSSFAVYWYLKSGFTTSETLRYELGLSRQSFSRSIKKLRAENIVESQGSTHKLKYLLKPESEWKI